LSLPLKTSTHHTQANHSKTSSKDLQGPSSSSRNHEDGSQNGYGISVKGNRTTGRGVYISKIEIDSPAYQQGLRVGDALLEINGQPFTSLHHEEAVKKCTHILKSEKLCSMTVRSPEDGSNSSSMGVAKYNSFDESQLHYHKDDEIYVPVPQSSDIHIGDSSSVHSVPQQKLGCIWIDRHGRSVSPPHDYHGNKKERIRRIDLLIEPGQSLGLMIRGGIEYGLGVFVTGVDKDSVAERAGLMVSCCC